MFSSRFTLGLMVHMKYVFLITPRMTGRLCENFFIHNMLVDMISYHNLIKKRMKVYSRGEIIVP